MSKLCVIAYVPDNRPRWHAKAFLQNLCENPPQNDLILFSETKLPLVENVFQIRDPEKMIANTPSRPFNISNVLFLTALKIVGVKLKDRGYSHFLYVESDTRMKSRERVEKIGQGRGKPKKEVRTVEPWDAVILREFESLKPEPIVAGSIAVYNPMNMDDEGRARWEALKAKNTKKNFPVAAYMAATAPEPCVMVYGSGGVYNIAAMLELFPINNDSIKIANSIKAWDLEIGLALWRKHGAGVFDKIGQLNSLFSTYGDRITTLKERMDMLTSGARCLVHQIKTDWRPQ